MLKRCWTVGAMTAAMTTLLITGMAEAQDRTTLRPGMLEIGAFGQWSWFDGNAGRPNAVPTNGLGYGGRLGLFLTDRVQIEGDGYYSPQARRLTDTFCCTGAEPDNINVSALAARLNYNFPAGGLAGRTAQFIVGAGVVRTNYAFRGGAADSSIASFGASGLAGVRVGLAERVAFRFDGVADYHPTHEPEPNLNLHARAGLSLLLGGALATPVVVPTPAPAPAPAPAPTPAPQPQAIQVCVIQDGQLRTVSAQVNPATGDTTMVVDGQTRRFRDVQPGTQAYATGRTWFVQSEPIQFMNRRYVRFGLTRVIGAGELTRVGEHQGVPVFAPTGQTTRPDVIYLPVRPGCEFQPFQHEAEIQVRG